MSEAGACLVANIRLEAPNCALAPTTTQYIQCRKHAKNGVFQRSAWSRDALQHSGFRFSEVISHADTSGGFQATSRGSIWTGDAMSGDTWALCARPNTPQPTIVTINNPRIIMMTLKRRSLSAIVPTIAMTSAATHPKIATAITAQRKPVMR